MDKSERHVDGAHATVTLLCLAIFMANAFTALTSVGAFFAFLTCDLVGFALDSEAFFLRAPRAIS